MKIYYGEKRMKSDKKEVSAAIKKEFHDFIIEAIEVNSGWYIVGKNIAGIISNYIESFKEVDFQTEREKFLITSKKLVDIRAEMQIKLPPEIFNDKQHKLYQYIEPFIKGVLDAAGATEYINSDDGSALPFAVANFCIEQVINMASNEIILLGVQDEK